jgi:HSP20 family protein
MDTKLAKRSRPGLLASWFKRDPFHLIREDFDQMMSRLAEEWDGNGAPESRAHLPSINVSETDKQLELTVDLPGITPEEVDLEISGNVLRVSGEHQEEQKEEGKHYHRVERTSGSFYRTIELPCAIDESQVVAECKNGVLTVTLPKAEPAVTRKVQVNG